MRRARPERTWDADSLYAYGLRLLSVRARSERELRQRFAQRGAPAELTEGTVERLRASGFIDDAAFAQAWVESRRRAAPRGDRLLQHELAHKGVARSTVEQALADAPVDALELARIAATKKARALAGQPEAVFARRLTDFLLRRGFDYDAAAQVVREFAAERES